MVKAPVIQLQKVNKSYQSGESTTRILRDISLEVQSGEMLAVVGASGSGKSTLMNIMGLLDKADSGTYTLARQNTDNLSDNALAELRNQTIGFVFQQFNLLPRLTAAQNVALPLGYRRGASSAIQETVHQALARVGMADYSKRYPNQLSGGQQQRVAIARALAGAPTLLLADEPTGALDSATSAEVMGLFHGLNQEGRTLIIVTHDHQVAAQCHRQIVIKDGQIDSEIMA